MQPRLVADSWTGWTPLVQELSPPEASGSRLRGQRQEPQTQQATLWEKVQSGWPRCGNGAAGLAFHEALTKRKGPAGPLLWKGAACGRLGPLPYRPMTAGLCPDEDTEGLRGELKPPEPLQQWSMVLPTLT